MRKAIALTTATAAFTATLGWTTPSAAAPADDPVLAELVVEDHYVEDGYEIDLAVTALPTGTVLTEVTIRDPSSTDEVDLWSDGETLWWDGTVDGERVRGNAPAADLLPAPDDPQAFICFHPIAAIACLGALAVLAAGCGYGFSCGGQTPKGSSNPPDSGGGAGAGGDADGEGDGDHGGSDESGD